MLSRRDFIKAGGAAVVGAGLLEPRPAQAVESWDETADVVVVGFGAAGASAAIDACKAGASVLVLERADTGGGTSALAGGIIYFGGGTPLQNALGFVDTPEEMFKYLMASCGPAPDEAKIRLYCERSVEHYEWTVAQGVPFKQSFYQGVSLPLTDDGLLFSGSEKAAPYIDIAKPAPRGHKPQVEGDGGGALLMEKLIASARKAGARVVSGATCQRLVRESDGRIAGVVATVGDSEKSFRAVGGVVLTAGGFCHNREMVERFAPLYLQCDTPIGSAGDDGSGIRMGMGAGGAAIRMDAGFSALPVHPPEKLMEGILVNRRGQRFVNEDSYYGRQGQAVVRCQDGGAILILDQGCNVESKYARPKLLGDAASIADAERLASLPEGTLQDSMRFYNRHAANGKDPLFHKAGKYVRPLDRLPYRVFDCSTNAAYYPFFTLGGLYTRPSGEVLDAAGEPIEGLYAAGRTTSGIAALGYSSGISLADATFFGRLAGQSAAQAAKSAGARGGA